jgi:sugar O-acyltransferase (sialic acid O-acetyltransferase NeuD family)
VTRIVIVGAGGQGAIVADILRGDAAGFVDDAPDLAGTRVLGLPVFGAIAVLGEIEHDGVIVAIGDNRTRRTVTERLVAAGERLAIAIHPFTSVSPSAAIGEGSMISAGAVVTPRAAVGTGALLNTRSSIDHDSVIGAFAHVAPGATIGANVRVGDGALIGSGATVASGIRIGARTTIGAGAVVVHDIGDDVVAIGVPARVR